MALLLIKALGILLVVLGVIFLIDNKRLQSFIKFWKKGSNIYLAGIIKVLVGVLFIVASADTNLLIFIFGMLYLVGGIIVFILGPKKVNGYIDYWAGKTSKNIPWIAACYLAMGILLIYLC
ncbi:MAG: hypothetical protein P9X27_00735 [Candidatus Kaelpia aquatica]|nr:hypothetical protein [Candidatus Kaelpia aquatica]